MVYFLAAGTLVAIPAGIVRFVMRSAAPALRYATSLTVLVLLALLPLAIALYLAPSSATEQPLTIAQRSNSAPAIDLALPNTASGAPLSLTEVVPRAPTPTALAAQVIDALPWLWLVGTPLTFLFLATGMVGAERLRRASVTVTDGPLREVVNRLRSTLSLGRNVAVAVCDRVATPILVGIVRPLILLPPAALTGWSPADLEMVLLHELAHVKRWDNLVNLGQRVVESALFFHPAVWIASRWVRNDREDCCDAVVVACTAKPQAYAELLVSLATASQPLAGLAMARHPLGNRVRRILHLPEEPMRVSRGTLLAISIAAILLTVAPAGRDVPAADAKEPAARKSQEAQEIARIDKRLDDLLTDPEKLRSLFDGQGQQRVTIQYQIKEKREGQTEDVLTGLEHDPHGPKITIQRHWVKKGKLLNVTAPQRAHDEFITPYLTKIIGPYAVLRASRGVPVAAADEENLPAQAAKDEEKASRLAIVDANTQAELQQAHQEIETLKRQLAALEQGRPPGPGPQDVLIFSAQQDAQRGKEPDVLQAGDVVLLRVKGALPEDPISDEFEIESMGTIALGPAYGRVKIAGHKLLEAEDLIRDYLRNYLDDPRVQLTLREKASPFANPFGNRFAPTPVRPPSVSDKLEVGDVVQLQVEGVPPDESFITDYEIEPMGTIAMGPNYRRVKIAGLNPIEAEDLVLNHLKKFMAGPRVQLTLKHKVGPVVAQFTPRTPTTPPPMIAVRDPYSTPIPAPAAGEAQIIVDERAASSQPTLAVVYDGKTFQQWRDQLKLELLPNKRMEAIEALEAFARAGIGMEDVANMFMEVAAQYDWSNQKVKGLQLACLRAFLDAIPRELALAKVLDAADDDNPRLRGFAIKAAGYIFVEADGPTSQAIKEKFPNLEPSPEPFDSGDGFGGGGF